VFTVQKNKNFFTLNLCRININKSVISEGKTKGNIAAVAHKAASQEEILVQINFATRSEKKRI